MVIRRRGSTLVELIVVAALWSAIMVATLGFYIYGTSVTRKNDLRSQQIRTLQHVGEIFERAFFNARILTVYEFPACVFFDRVDNELPVMPGVLLPNIKGEMESLWIGPNPDKTSETDPAKCADNGLFRVRRNGPKELLLDLPHGLIFEFRSGKGVLMLIANDPQRAAKLPQPSAREVADSRAIRWETAFHYFFARGLGADTLWIPNPVVP